MFIWLLFAAVGVVPIVGAVLAFRARRGRRLDDHRVCAKCRYDLHGSPADATACPECGASLSRRRATYTGNRALHGRMLTLGLLMFLIGLSGAAYVGLTARRGYNWNQHTPMPLLIHDAFESGHPWRSRSSAYAFYDRHQAGTLSNQDYTRIVEGLLDYQADPAKPWVFFWGDLMEIFRHAGHVTDDQWRRFITQMYTWELVGDPTVELGGEWVYAFSLVGSPRSSTAKSTRIHCLGYGPNGGDQVDFSVTGVTNDGTEIDVADPRVIAYEDYWAVADTSGWLTTSIDLPPEEYPPGRYTCSVSIEWSLYDPKLTTSYQYRPPPGVVLRTSTFTYTATFEVVEP